MSTSNLAQTLDAWAREVVARRVREFEASRVAALADPDDSAALHHVRTRARRVRAAIEDLHELVPEADAMLRALERLGRRTGEARDNDVLLARVERHLGSAYGATRVQLERIAKRLRRRRARLRERAKSALGAGALATEPERAT